MFSLCISQFAVQSYILLLCRDFHVSRHHKHGSSQVKFRDIFSWFLDMEVLVHDTGKMKTDVGTLIIVPSVQFDL